MAEWSKALVLGTSLSGREFESRHCQDSILGPVGGGHSSGKVGRVV